MAGRPGIDRPCAAAVGAWPAAVEAGSATARANTVHFRMQSTATRSDLP